MSGMHHGKQVGIGVLQVEERAGGSCPGAILWGTQCRWASAGGGSKPDVRALRGVQCMFIIIER